MPTREFKELKEKVEYINHKVTELYAKFDIFQDRYESDIKWIKFALKILFAMVLALFGLKLVW